MIGLGLRRIRHGWEIGLPRRMPDSSATSVEWMRGPSHRRELPVGEHRIARLDRRLTGSGGLG